MMLDKVLWCGGLAVGIAMIVIGAVGLSIP